MRFKMKCCDKTLKNLKSQRKKQREAIASKCVTEWAMPRMESMKNRLAITYDNLKKEKHVVERSLSS